MLTVLQLHEEDILFGKKVEPQDTMAKTGPELPIVIDDDIEEETPSKKGTFSQPKSRNTKSEIPKKDTTDFPRHCSNCFCLAHRRPNCPALLCKYCDKRGHVNKQCPVWLAKRTKQKNDLHHQKKIKAEFTGERIEGAIRREYIEKEKAKNIKRGLGEPGGGRLNLAMEDNDRQTH